MNIVYGDLIQMTLDGKFDIIAHGCNCVHTMKAGIAAQISDVFPMMAMADKAQYNTPGSWSGVQLEHGTRGMNWYTQMLPGPNFRLAYLQCMVTHMRTDFMLTSTYKCVCMREGRDPDAKIHIGVPLIGGGIGNGNPFDIKAVLASLEADGKYEVSLVLWDPSKRTYGPPPSSTLAMEYPGETKTDRKVEHATV